MAFKTVKRGQKGDLVKALQYIVGADPDGDFGPDTEKKVKAYQKANGLEADGKAGKLTFGKIVELAPYLRVGSSGPYVYAVEVLLNTLTLDGVYKEDELKHVKTYQASRSIEVDGVVGPESYSALFGLTQPTIVPVPAQDDDLNPEPTTEQPVVIKKPVDYKQYDSKWGSIPYTITGSSSQTIKSSGCGPTSSADIVATWFDKKFTPKESCALAKANGYRTKNSGTLGSFQKFIAKKYGVKKYVQTSSFATMQACLAEGGYVVVNVKKSKWTTGGHYIVFWKDDGKYIYVNDPASAKSERAKGTYSEVKAAAHQYYCFWPN